MAQSILVVDDDAAVLNAMSRALTRAGYAVIRADTAGAGLRCLENEPTDLVLLDLHLPDRDGLALLGEMRQLGFEQPVVMMSGDGSINEAVEAMRLGALDFISKPLLPDRVLARVQNALRMSTIAERAAQLEAELRPGRELLGDSAPMEQLRELIARTAPTEGRVLITGENGTGKELVARALHQGSGRSEGSFIKVNCAAIPADLIESELFGHERGAFTGAVAARRGRFERADGGTLFLDEVGEMSLPMQAKLLRVLQEGELERVGGDRAVAVDVRVLAATNRDIEAMIKDGVFREDLYYRLNVVNLHTPALRDRVEDIPLLAERFLQLAIERNHRGNMSLAPEAVRHLCGHNYPGNVRELQNLIERLVILSDGPAIDGGDVESVLSPRSDRASSGPLFQPGETFRDLSAAAQARILTEALAHYGGSMAKTARALGMERSHLYKKCKSLGVNTSQ